MNAEGPNPEAQRLPPSNETTVNGTTAPTPEVLPARRFRDELHEMAVVGKEYVRLKYCDCAGCYRPCLGERTVKALGLAAKYQGVPLIVGRIDGRPYCRRCLDVHERQGVMRDAI